MSATILVVDDSLTVRMDLSDALGRSGYSVRSCASAAEARRAFADGGFALVLLDVLLPDGDGIELLRELRGHGPGRDVPVIVLSTEDEVRDRLRGVAVGASEYVGKPYDLDQVLDRVASLLRPRGAPRPADGAPSVLVVDDSETYRRALEETLSRNGYRVLTAASGEEGLHLTGRERPDAILVDGHLPGIDGPTLIRRLRLDPGLQRTPCLLLTASAEYQDEVAALDAGADAFARKEPDPTRLLARVAALLRGSESRAAADAESLFGPKRILAVDDSRTFREELANRLRSDGFDVVLAGSGEEALALLQVQTVDCILLDLIMPGWSGLETCQRIRSRPDWATVPVIILTAREDLQAMVEGIQAGADDYVQKSGDFEVLRARLRAQLRRHQLEVEHRRVREELARSELAAQVARSATELAETRAALVAELEASNAALELRNRALAEANRELDAFTYSVSHDLAAPLRVIGTFSRYLLEDHAQRLPPEGQDLLGRLRAAAERLGRLVDALLGLSRIGRAELTCVPVDLAPMAREILAELRTQDPERSVALELPETLPVHGDPTLLRIALENLLRNAWKFTRRTAAPRIRVGQRVETGEPVIFVADNGVGFDPAHQHRLFGPFQRLHPEAEFEGTGIGLATVQRIVRRHGGRIWAESTPGAGATFSFTLGSAGGQGGFR